MRPSDLRQPARGRRIAVWLALGLGLVVHFTLGLHMMRPPKIESGDGVEYLDTAYHLRHDLTFTGASGAEPAPPGIGREPVYPAVLAVLMAVDPALGDYRPGCIQAAVPCDARQFIAIAWLNLGLIELAGLCLFWLASDLAGDAVAGLAAAGYVLLNISLLRSHWSDPMSDSLALALVAGTMLCFRRAWASGRPGRWALAGLSFAALILTKAIFLTFAIGIALVATGRFLVGAWRGDRAGRQILRDPEPPGAPTPGGPRLRGGWRMMAVAAAVVLVLVGGWAVRNRLVSGAFRLTDARGGIALSTREVFDHMTAAQWAAAFVYWSPGGGEALAKRIFAPATVAPFELYAADGFYDRGQNGYGRRVETLMGSEGLDLWQARAAIDRAIVGEIAAKPLGYLLSTLPLIWRGLWFDQFAIVALPCLVVLAWRAARAGKSLLALLLGFGLYNELSYALFSLNIQRYQVTAIPSLALAASLGLSALTRRGLPRLRSRWARRRRPADGIAAARAPQDPGRPSAPAAQAGRCSAS